MQQTWEEMRSAMRRSMRIFSPFRSVTPKTTASQPSERSEEQRRREDAERKAIVSVRGQDLSSEDEIADAPPAPAKGAA